jgi:hypothetical protein
MFAGAIVLYGGVAVAIMTRYTVVVSNTSQERLENVRVLGGGCGGHTTVTVQRDVKIVVAHLAVRELAWADRIRDELFWLNHAACAALAGSDTRRLTRVVARIDRGDREHELE